MPSFMVILTGAITLIQLWWISAYTYAYTQIRDQRLLLQVVQGAAFGLLFTLITMSLVTGFHLNGVISGVLLMVGLGTGYLWRKRDGVNLLFEHYQSGMIDVMVFRKAGNHKEQQDT